jgi:hypothetical protein
MGGGVSAKSPAFRLVAGGPQDLRKTITIFPFGEGCLKTPETSSLETGMRRVIPRVF